jgi:hypothetical protein
VYPCYDNPAVFAAGDTLLGRRGSRKRHGAR